MPSLGDRLRFLFGGGPPPPRRPASADRIDRVAPWLYVGAALSRSSYGGLPALGVTHVLDLRQEGSDDADLIERLGMRWYRIEIPDREPPTDEQFEAILDWLDREADSSTDQAVYVHCHAGLTRTPTIAIALLIQQRLSLAEARRLVLAARPEVEPSARQMAWLELFEARRRPPDAIAPPEG